MNKKGQLILIGGGGHCRSVIDVIEQEKKYRITGILDAKEKIGDKVLSYSILGSDDDIKKYAAEGYFFLITLGQIKSPTARIRLYNEVKKHSGKLAVVKSPLAYVSKHAMIADGTIVMHHAIINASASIGENCIINTKALIEHDALIGSHCHISTSAVVNGGVTINDNSFLGSNAVTVEYITIPKNSFIRAGSLFTGKK
jgi:sugar O-acyltransferase (sialic acid O-acetyltransferase NeuD family)